MNVKEKVKDILNKYNRNGNFQYKRFDIENIASDVNDLVNKSFTLFSYDKYPIHNTKKAILSQNQYDLFREINAADINIVTCGNCGSVILHRIEPDIEELTCPYCGYESEPCDFPDFIV